MTKVRSLLIDQQVPIDAQWFKRLQESAKYTLEMYAWLGPSPRDLLALQKAFEKSDYQASPSLRPSDSKCAAIISEKQQLTNLLSDITQHEPNELVREAYHLRLQELIDNASMYEAVLLDNASEFSRLNQAVYTGPDVSVFAAVCDRYRGLALEWGKQDPALISYSQAVLDLLPQPKVTPINLEPSEAVFANQRHLHFSKSGFYSLLFEGLDLPSGVVTSEPGDRLIRKVLKNLGAEDYAIHDAHDGCWGLRFGVKSVDRPPKYELSAEEFIGVAGHEIGSHLLERINGRRQKLNLLSFGLQGYEKGNEGRALLREQIVYPAWSMYAATESWHSVLRYHLAISLALGLDGPDNKPRTFAEVYRIVHAVDLLWGNYHQGQADSPQEISAHAQTWQLLTRVLNGTDGQSGAYYKDIVYLEGNLACWQLAAIRPSIISEGDAGKIDIANSVHLQLLESL
jgi:hypothetical protein